MKKLIRNKVDYQIIVYTDEQHSPAGSFPIPPRATRELDISDDQIAYIRNNYPVSEIQIS